MPLNHQDTTIRVPNKRMTVNGNNQEKYYPIFAKHLVINLFIIQTILKSKKVILTIYSKKNQINIPLYLYVKRVDVLKHYTKNILVFHMKDFVIIQAILVFSRDHLED